MRAYPQEKEQYDVILGSQRNICLGRITFLIGREAYLPSRLYETQKIAFAITTSWIIIPAGIYHRTLVQNV